MPKAKNSEVHAYVYIKEQLKLLGWNVKNPAKHPEGEVYTQNECLQHPEIKRCLNLDKPENVIKLSETNFWIIEAKPEHNQLNIALQEAQEYGDKINKKNKQIKALIITGIAGNDEDTYLIKHRYWDGKGYVPITVNKKEITGLLSKELAEEILKIKKPNIEDIPFIPEEVFLQKAESINEILHNGGINLNLRAKYIAAIILCYAAKTMPNRDNEPKELIEEINARIEEVLEKEGKKEFASYIKLTLPTKRDNHLKIKTAIIKTFQELDNLNIRSAMNSSTDVLGKFYEVFLKYGNGAKEIGIVLTPRHITEFAADVININHRDIVYDPTCGTAGFLVAAFDYIRKNSTEEQTNQFKKYNLFGIDQDEPVIALAIVNMIFRGDGKNNIMEGNCFQKGLMSDVKKGINTAKYVGKEEKEGLQPDEEEDIELNAVTKVLMNPPFALKTDPDKEYKFIQYALNEMQDGGILFAILPISVMIEKSALTWRREQLLKENTLLSVVTFPEDLFYPVSSNHTLGIFVKKGMQHPKNQKVLWIRALNDGFLKKKGKRLRNSKAQDNLSKVKDILKGFIINPNQPIKNIPEFQKAETINFDDIDLELVPEAYLDDETPDYTKIINEIEKLVKETAGYLLTLGKTNIIIKTKGEKIFIKNKLKYFDLTGKNGLCNVERKYAPYLNELESDVKIIPYVTTTEFNNGVSLRCDTDPNFKRDSLTVSLDGKCGTTFYQFENFISGEKTAVLTLKEKHNPYLLFYIGALIRIKSWRYHYGRKLSMGRLKSFKLPLPINGKGEIDIEAIEKVVKNSYGWEIIEAHLKNK